MVSVHMMSMAHMGNGSGTNKYNGYSGILNTSIINSSLRWEKRKFFSKFWFRLRVFSETIVSNYSRLLQSD